jgi:hypothetical protein
MNNSFQPDIFDPRTWNALDSRMVDILVQKGPKRDLSIEHDLRDKFSRRFSALSYTQVIEILLTFYYDTRKTQWIGTNST